MKTIKILDKELKCQDDARQTLSDYLRSIEELFKDQTEVIDDVKHAILELLDEFRSEKADHSVTKKDVEKLIEKLGTVEQIKEQSVEQIEEEKLVVSKRLFRDKKRGWIGGVCAGLAAYMGLPIWVLRLAFIIAIPAPIPSLIPYLVLWYLLPPSKTKSDELQMQGMPVSLSSLSNTKDYTRKKVIGLAKAIGILVALLAILITAIIGLATISFFVDKDENGVASTSIYEYDCDNIDDARYLYSDKYGYSLLINYGEDAKEYDLLYENDGEMVFEASGFLDQINNDKWQFTLKKDSLDMIVLDRHEGKKVDTCKLISIKPGNSGSGVAVFEGMQDFFKIDKCLNKGSVWNYDKRECVISNNDNN